MTVAQREALCFLLTTLHVVSVFDSCGKLPHCGLIPLAAPFVSRCNYKPLNSRPSPVLTFPWKLHRRPCAVPTVLVIIFLGMQPSVYIPSLPEVADKESVRNLFTEIVEALR